MSKEKDNLLTMMALDDYEMPKIPTLEKANPELLKKVPSRWKNKAFIAAASLSILSVIPLSGCEYGFHLGGAGPAPIYVAHLTETDALNMIQVHLEEAGLNFTNVVPAYMIERWGHEYGIDLFDAERNIAITFINHYNSTKTSSIDDGDDHDRWNHGRWKVTGVQGAFEEAHEAMTFGVFYNPIQRRHWRGRNRENPHTDEEFELLTAALEEQIQAFIEDLQREGLID